MGLLQGQDHLETFSFQFAPLPCFLFLSPHFFLPGGSHSFQLCFFWGNWAKAVGAKCYRKEKLRVERRPEVLLKDYKFQQNSQCKPCWQGDIEQRFGESGKLVTLVNSSGVERREEESGSAGIGKQAQIWRNWGLGDIGKNFKWWTLGREGRLVISSSQVPWGALSHAQLFQGLLLILCLTCYTIFLKFFLLVFGPHLVMRRDYTWWAVGTIWEAWGGTQVGCVQS